MKDIRNFFGGGGGGAASNKPVEPKIEKSKAKTFSQKNEEDDDFLIESSDEEWKSDAKPERKRLKGKNTVVKSPVASTRMTTSESVESTSVKEVRNLIPTVIDLEEDHGAVPSSPALKSPVKAELASPASNKIVLPVMKTSVKSTLDNNATAATNDKKRKEVDPNTFFGLPPSTPTKSVRSPPAKKVKAEPTSDDEAVSTAVKSPAGKRGAKSPAASKDNSGWLVNELKFVITGVLNSGSREDVENMILSAGGKVAKAVSGKTDYLVTGVLLEDGRPVNEGSKYKTAVEKGVKVVTEEELMNMLAADAEKKAKTQPLVKIESKAAFSSLFGGNSSNSSSSSGGAAGAKNQETEADMLWVDKHKPKTSSELIGSAELVRKMSDWLKRWDEVHIKKTAKVPFSKENPGARAVLLSGPPGIGKTTVATLIAKEFGYDLLELNASDTRNKKEIGDQLTDAVMSKAISSMSFLGSSSCLKRRLIIMDEVDGMGGSDRGGVAELIKIIKTTKTPIVCICNDRQSPKIKSLVNHCYDLRVKRPTKQQIATRLVAIAAKEGMQMDQNAGEILVEQVGNDIRQALNTMQMWKASSRTMQYTEVKNAMNRIEKDKVLRQTPFDACLQILGGSKAPLEDRYNSFFIDYSLLPLMIQQNYIDSAKNGIFKQPQLDEAARMDVLSRAADAVSDVDMIGARIMGQDQHWELLPAQAAFCCKVGSVVQGFQPFPSFPAWLGKNSSQNKMSRLTKEIVHHSSLSIGQGFCPVRLDYVPYVRETLLNLLLNNANGIVNSDSNDGPGDAVSQVIDMLDAYGLSKDDMMETLKEMQFVIDGDKQFKDRYDLIETKVKTALTKAYNNSAHRSQVLVSEIASKGKKGRGGGGGGARAVAFDEDGNLIEDESAMADEEELVEDDEDDNIDAFIAKSKKAKAADKSAKAAAKTSASGSNSGSGKGKK